MFDEDKNNLVSVTEFINGYVNVLEQMGVKIKKEFRESIAHVAEIVEISHAAGVEINLPTLNTLVQLVATKMNAYSHGLIKLEHLQAMTGGFFNLERVMVTQQSSSPDSGDTSSLTVNSKLLVAYILAKMDKNSDGFICQADFVATLMGHLKYLNVTMSPKVGEYLKAYLDIYETSVQTLLNKYGLSDISASN